MGSTCGCGSGFTNDQRSCDGNGGHVGIAVANGSVDGNNINF